ncbi:MAG: hypothetical protein IID52_02985 [Proteobacteria bacterium]|nr:hypothetical protein [Pseudomonadota bacterium]
MASGGDSILGHKHLNGWKLFGLIVFLISVAVVSRLTQINTTNPADISGMIQFSVRLAVPWLFIAFAASSMVYVLPNNLTKWVMRNRRLIGLCFAAGMAWQLFFIFWFVFGFFGYYMEEAYSYYDLSEQIPGYLVLFAMTFTSFKFGRNMLSPRQWRILHKGSIYFIWAVVWGTYWFELYFYDDMYDELQTIDYVYYWIGIAAWGVRIVAWGLKRRLKQKLEGMPGLPALIVSGGLIGIGFFLLLFGNLWTPLNPDTFDSFSFAGWAALFVPYLAMVPIFAAAVVASPARG